LATATHSLKGRFILDPTGELVWVPRPRVGPDGVRDLYGAPRTVVPYEYMLPDTPDGPVTVGFPYAWTLARIAFMPRVQAFFTKRTGYSSFCAADHPSGALPLTIALADAFTREAGRRDKRALVVMLPSASSFRERAAHGEFDYAPLITSLKVKEIDVLDGGVAVLGALAGRTYCLLYSEPNDCSGHYGREGGAILADVVAAQLRQRGLVRP
jgi:hypothetical protein